MLLMKNSLKILLLSALAYGCSVPEHPVEDELYNCLVQEYQSKGINLPVVLDSLENHYIRNGILQDKSGHSKLAFYKQIAHSGEVPVMTQYPLADSVGKIKFFQQEMEACIHNKGFDSLTLKRSTYFQLMEDFKTIREVNPKNAAASHVNCLTATDFEHPYFRAHMLITFTRIYERPGAFIRR